MNTISGKLSSKGQITVPKTVRDFLGVVENDSVDFVINEGKVYMERSKRTLICPFCTGKDFYGERCEVCKGVGTLEEMNKQELVTNLYQIFLEKEAVLTIDTREEFYRVEVETDDIQVKRYREHFQMEFIKIVLKKYKMKQLLDKELKEKLLMYLEFETSKQSFSRWWDSLIDRYVK